MSMRTVTTALDRAYWNARERALCREIAEGGETITHPSCLPADELAHLNRLADETRACLTSETEIRQSIAAVEHEIAILRAPLPFVVRAKR